MLVSPGVRLKDSEPGHQVQTEPVIISSRKDLTLEDVDCFLSSLLSPVVPDTDSSHSPSMPGAAAGGEAACAPPRWTPIGRLPVSARERGARLLTPARRLSSSEP